VRLNTESLGHGPELAMLHGWGMHAGFLEAFASRLADRHRLTLVELPGHGRSPWDPAWTSFEHWVEASLQAAPPRAIWLGWSLGGLLGLGAALAAPQRVERLLLVASTPRFTRTDDWPAAMPGETLAQFADTLAIDPSATLQRFLALQVRGGESARDLLRELQRRLGERTAAQAPALARGLEILANTDVRRELAMLACPNRWLFGARDTLVPAAVATAVCAACPTAQVVSLTGAGHAPLLSHPAACLASIEEFLA
jgi:pimeloyl-[acyl-carrier protein] methyl ester esterase